MLDRTNEVVVIVTAMPATSRPLIMPSSAPLQTSTTPSADQRSSAGNSSSNWQTVNGYDRPKTDMRYVRITMIHHA